MILNNPFVTLAGKDRNTGNPVINLSSDRAPTSLDGVRTVEASLSFSSVSQLWLFIKLLKDYAEAIETMK